VFGSPSELVLVRHGSALLIPLGEEMLDKRRNGAFLGLRQPCVGRLAPPSDGRHGRPRGPLQRSKSDSERSAVAEGGAG
jgi:hypothetical protein